MRVTTPVTISGMDVDWQELEYHQLCTIFPEMLPEEYDSLVASMILNGYLDVDPIVLIDTDPDGSDCKYKVLDGRNRHLAAMDAGVTPSFIAYGGKDPFQFVIARNTDRRHMTTGQKAAVASKIANIKVGETGAVSSEKDGRPDGLVSRKEAATALGTSDKAVQRFRAVEKANPELAAQVEAGEVTLNAAEMEIKDIKTDPPKTEPKPKPKARQNQATCDDCASYIMVKLNSEDLTEENISMWVHDHFYGEE